MLARIKSLVKWFRAEATPDFVWNHPGVFVERAAQVWSSNFLAWLDPQAEAMRAAASRVVKAVSKVISKTSRSEGFKALQKDALSCPLPASWNEHLAAIGNGDALDTASLLRSAAEEQRRSPYLAALAINYLLRDDQRGKPWIALWPGTKAARESGPAVQRAAQLCHALDTLCRWADASAEGDYSKVQPNARRPKEAETTNTQDLSKANTPAWLTLKQASALLGTDENGNALIPASSLRKQFLNGNIAGTRSADSCNARILLSRKGLQNWLARTDPSRRRVLSPAEASRANKTAR